MSEDHENDSVESIAIVGMAGRFPGAKDLEELWANLRDGVDCIRDLTDDDLRESGLDPAALPPNYVKCAAPVDGIDLFDAGFFGFSPREAEILDPQSRLFLECAWEALESAGYAADPQPGWTGVFAGVSVPAYLMTHLMSNPAVMSAVDPFQLLLANDRDYFATRIAYKLNLRGPALNVQTACSTSLVATHLACQSLLAYQCTMAVAGGVRLAAPQKSGYLAQEGSIFSPDGRCRAFDAEGKGALFGEGIGVVVLKRLSEAIADGDPIHAVIRGSAFNNDGSLKVGYTAPSVEGQAEVIALAQAVAGVGPETIGYVEAHGSGTPLGDPIEVAALTRAFRAGTEARGFCALGSIKTNVGHLESAAGIAGLIKAALALEREAIPPSLHFEKPNPQIDFESSPFYVNTRLREWPRGEAPRRAGVSSFGMGGTNVHVILEEAPEREPSSPGRTWQLLVLSARTPTALERTTDDFADWLEAHPEESFPDTAWTLQAGRRAFPHRRALVCRDREDALAALRNRDGRRLLGSVQETAERPVAFLLPGLGDHYAGMALGLYQSEPTFRAGIDRVAELLRREGIDLLPALFPSGTEEAQGGLDLRAMLGKGREAGPLDRTEIAQPAVFAVEHALAELLMEWGIRPAALAGYSLGEYTAACLAGVLSFEDALLLVARRARLIGQLPAGAMLSVALPEDEARELASEEISLAAVNGPALSVLAGPVAAIETLEKDLAGRGVAVRRLPTTHAFHSRMMEPLRSELADLLRGVRLSPPEIPYLSNVTGTWVTAEQATDPAFWVRHLVEPVRFGRSVAELLREPGRVLVEVGPGQGLTSLALQLADGEAPVAVPALRPSYDRQADGAFLLGALARLWLAGLPVDWTGFAAHEQRQRLRLPTYPFERRRYWIERPSSATVAIPVVSASEADKPALAAIPSATVRHDRPANLRNAYAPPTTEEERRLVEIWQALLGVEPIGIHDSFFELGGHSLLAPQLLVHLRQAFGVDFPLAHLFEAPTIAELAEAVDLLRREGKAALEAREEKVDLRAEAKLDPEIRAEAPWTGPMDTLAEVFLSGGTGFLGAHILAELLERTDARVHCLLRAADAGEGFRRLRNALESRELWRDGMADRIVVLAGDLGLPRFGLSEEAFRDLAGRIDAVYHGGAWVNFTYPYKILKPANVLGTVEALRLAALGRVKPVHYVSSIAAVPEIEYGYRDDPRVFEDDETGSISGLFGGYGETKWVSEQLCRIARSRGIPVAIYRPSVLSGDSRTGRGNTRDMVWSMIKGSIQMGIAPPGDQPFDVAPVDYVAAAIVHLSLQEESLNRVFQLPHTQVPLWQDIFDFMHSYGYELRSAATPDEWIEHALERLKEDTTGENALSPFAPMVAISDRYSEIAASEERTGTIKPLIFDDRNTQAGLQGSGITCAPLDARLLSLYFDDLVSSRFLPTPSLHEGAAGQGVAGKPLRHPQSVAVRSPS
ncbi:MAG TPA: thioester reductase domain-containing protein [Thermoanaerobaculia bacterium]|nr:thioester reductase domain-containing protein [Thermoanaerobaculia bacterium]